MHNTMECPPALTYLRAVYEDYNRILGPSVAHIELRKRTSKVSDQDLHEACTVLLGRSRCEKYNRQEKEKIVCAQIRLHRS
jgi:hypothetical protein